MAKRETNWKYVADKCNPPPVDMGHAMVFANAIPGVNDTIVRPFGWSEYESAFRPQYVPDPCHYKKCRDPCRPCAPKNGAPKLRPKEWVDPKRYTHRSGICNLCNNVKCCCTITPPWDELKEKVTVYDPDNVRSLIVHGELKNEHPVVIACKDYQNILENRIGKSKEERDREAEQERQCKEMERIRCKQQADALRCMDEAKYRQEISPEAQEDMNAILSRSRTLINDDEPAIRAINSVILAAKVQAIREAQLAERQLIKCEQAEEERRILGYLAADKFIPDDYDDDEALQKREQYKMALQQQLQEREAYKFLEKEMKEAEQEGLRRMWEQEDCKDMQESAMIAQKKQQLGNELLQDQMFHEQMKRQLKEFEKLEDQKMVEWQRQKAAEEEANEQKKKEMRKEKEMAVKSGLDLHKKTLDERALRDDMKAKRHMEQKEREWRRKEKEDMLKRQEQAAKLKQGIMEQIEQRREYFIQQAAQDKALYDSIFGVQGAKIDEERIKEEEKAAANAKYRYDIREQIHDYQLRKIEERKNHFIEGINLRKQIKAKDQLIRCTMEEKIEQLRSSNLPEKYINYIRKAAGHELGGR